MLSLYIDGQLDIELEGIESPNSNNENFEVGRWTGGATQYFNGLIDDVGVWNRRLDVDEIIGLFNAEAPVYGCVDIASCNFNPAANVGDGSCEYGCLNCGPGTMWDETAQLCVVANPSDTDFDSCVGMIDLLDLLSAFGTCSEIPWSCGDALEYQGYDYETVQIGEQCWFAENLRSENYENGDLIPSNLTDSERESQSSGAASVYEEDAFYYESYGLLYNWYAVTDARGLCPSGWHAPTDEEWMGLEMTLGMSEEETNETDWRGTNQGQQMKTDYGWGYGGNGSNSSGFSAVPGGYRRFYGSYQLPTVGVGYWWTSNPEIGINRALRTDQDKVQRRINNPNNGFSVRCLKDSE